MMGHDVVGSVAAGRDGGPSRCSPSSAWAGSSSGPAGGSFVWREEGP
jgi:hypothetical protein